MSEQNERQQAPAPTVGNVTITVPRVEGGGHAATHFALDLSPIAGVVLGEITAGLAASGEPVTDAQGAIENLLRRVADAAK